MTANLTTKPERSTPTFATEQYPLIQLACIFSKVYVELPVYIEEAWPLSQPECDGGSLSPWKAATNQTVSLLTTPLMSNA